MIARAPGKLMLAGEYAVLHGAPALVMAVNRHAVVRARREGGAARELPPEVSATFAWAIEEGWLKRAPSAGELTIELSALAGEGGKKLGLGSSAAGCVAALAWALAREGATSFDRAHIALTARAGHRRAQGGGSGVDVLASALGGVVRACLPAGLDGRVEVGSRAWSADIPWRVLWSGTPARTSDMIAKVDALRARDAGVFEGFVRAVSEATEAFDEALRAADVPGLVVAVAAHYDAMRALGERAGAPIVTPELARLAAAIEPFGAVVKPSGAGGGDVSLLFAHDRGALDEATRAASKEGFAVVDLEPDPHGVAVSQEDEA